MSIQDRYSELEVSRNIPLQRARDCAEVTIPSLMPPAGHTESTELPSCWSAVGAKCVNSLASKLLLALLPVNQPWFRFQYPTEGLSSDDMTKIEVTLASWERQIMEWIESNPVRIKVFEALKQLIVSGSSLLYIGDPDPRTKQVSVQCYKLDQYVVQKDSAGNVLEIITEEGIAPVAIPDKTKNKIPQEKLEQDQLTLYTSIVRKDGKNGKPDLWYVEQEIEGIPVGKPGTYPLDECPWIPVDWVSISGENYGRSHCYEYLGDLKNIEGLAKALIDYSSAAAMTIFGVSGANAVQVAKRLTKAKNLSFEVFNPDNVKALQLGTKSNDISVVANTLANIEARLSAAFLVMTARDSERTTATEIQAQIKELEDTLGGVYSTLAQSLQRPLLKRIITVMEKQKALPPMPKDSVNVIITTGLEALGRSAELQKKLMFLQTIQSMPGAQDAINWAQLIKQVAVDLNLDTTEFILSDEEIAAKQQRAMYYQLGQQMLPGLMQMAAKQPQTNNQTQ